MYLYPSKGFFSETRTKYKNKNINEIYINITFISLRPIQTCYFPSGSKNLKNGLKYFVTYLLGPSRKSTNTCKLYSPFYCVFFFNYYCNDICKVIYNIG